MPVEPGQPGCWNSIGVWRRDQAPCPRLAEYAHCRNCPAFSGMARKVLQQPPQNSELSGLQVASTAEQQANVVADGLPLFIFRLGDDLVALPSNLVQKITVMSTIFPFPNRQASCLRGMVNLDGRLKIVVSLGTLLHIRQGRKNWDTDRQTRYERLVLIQKYRDDWVFPVSEVVGRYVFDKKLIEKNAEQSSISTMEHVDSVVDWHQDKVLLLSFSSLNERIQQQISGDE
ncbi:purine-binding chemotaxis protein CheW [Thiolapillus brandeum]|uniref:Purine-binding chemotaxis protein CheW n=2 Tax=Thiolapillus brandeum TaxID=1076588 RepID=A0A7U6GIU6_9GAMM|nr:purine-binding chemotaxis protein CheW [Thiolapillus brandeum]